MTRTAVLVASLALLVLAQPAVAATVPTIEDCTSRAQLMGEASLLGRLVPCLFFNVGQQESCCSAAHDLLGNDADADMDLELCLCQPDYLPVLDDLLEQYPVLPRQTVFDIFSTCNVPHIKTDGTPSNCPA